MKQSKFQRQLMLALGLVVLVGCGTASEDTDKGAAAESTRPWSKDRFGLEATEPGAYSNGDAYWTFHDWITDLEFSKVPSPFGKIHLGYSEHSTAAGRTTPVCPSTDIFGGAASPEAGGDVRRALASFGGRARVADE